MPVDKQVMLRYQVLNKCFRNKYREYTIDDLVKACNDAMQKEYDIEAGISKRTIQIDIAKLQMPPYNIRLQENFKEGRKRLYRYEDINFSIPFFKINDTERNKIIEAINVLKTFEGDPQYDWVRLCLMQIESGCFEEHGSSVVSFQSNPDLKGLSFFPILMEFIRKKKTLRLTYKPYGKNAFIFKIFPYYLKQYNNRWFLLARENGFNNISIYALDRIVSFEEIAIPYIESEINFEEYFDDVIGVSIPHNSCENIVLKISRKRYNYIETKPIHLSQKVLEQDDSSVTIQINVIPNNELKALLLSYGEDIEVISPKEYREEFSELVYRINRIYTNNENNLHTK